ncbi:hypothetical protein M569_05710, partial [Genlisea aurea]
EFRHAPPRNADGGEGGGEARYEWDFTLTAVVSSSSSASDAIGVIEFDQTDSLLATGGIARRIRIYVVEKLAGSDAACEFYMCTPAKLSSLKWKPGSGSRILGSGDYDGVVLEHDLERRFPVYERDEHSGRRVWSIDYASEYSSLSVGASASDDGTAQMWDARCDSCDSVAVLKPDPLTRTAICSVEFNPFGGHLVVVGSADRRVYGYDVRRMAAPVFKLDGHQKPVTYAKFLDGRTIVSSSTDGCLKMWRPEDLDHPIRTYSGHTNARRFVGLSVWRSGGLLCCGSEDNNVFVYDNRWSNPIWIRGFEETSNGAQRQSGSDPFVSGVCWRQSSCGETSTLVAGGSDGVLKVFGGRKR